MNWLKKNWLRMLSPVFILVFIGTGFFTYAKYYKPKMESKRKSVEEAQKKHDFENRFSEFSSMISVGLCQEAYNEFITTGSKERKGDNFFAHCKYRKEQWSDFNITTTVFSPDYRRADIKYTYNLTRANLDSPEFKKCSDNFLTDFQFCESIAPKEILRKDTIETWLVEDGKWKRDY